MAKHEVDLLLIDDNDVYCNMLLGELNKCIKQINIKSRFAINVHAFNNPRDCILSIKRLQFKDTIAFIDYYLGEAINGAHILKLLNEHNKIVSAIMISNSANIKYKLNHLNDQNIHLHFVVKDQYTPAVCALFLELYLNDLH